jgi:hypothetical protein
MHLRNHFVVTHIGFWSTIKNPKNIL